MDSTRCPRGTLYPQKLAITSPTRGGRSVGIVRSLTQAMEFSLAFTPSRRYFPSTPLPTGKLSLVFYTGADTSHFFLPALNARWSVILLWTTFILFALTHPPSSPSTPLSSAAFCCSHTPPSQPGIVLQFSSWSPAVAHVCVTEHAQWRLRHRPNSVSYSPCSNFHLLGYDAVYVYYKPTFRWNVSPIYPLSCSACVFCSASFFYPEDGGSMLFRNVCEPLPDLTAVLFIQTACRTSTQTEELFC
jgi:hypothetical protein